MMCPWCRSAGEALTVARDAATPEQRDIALTVAAERHAQCPDPACPCHHDIAFDALQAPSGAV